MDNDKGKSQYGRWKSQNTRFDPSRYSKKPAYQSKRADTNRTNNPTTNPVQSKYSSTSNVGRGAGKSSGIGNTNKHSSSTNLPSSSSSASSSHSNSAQFGHITSRYTSSFDKSRKGSSKDVSPDSSSVSDKFQNINLNPRSAVNPSNGGSSKSSYQLSTNSQQKSALLSGSNNRDDQKTSANGTRTSHPRISGLNNNNKDRVDTSSNVNQRSVGISSLRPRSKYNGNSNQQLSTKPPSSMSRSSDIQYNLSLIRPSDRVVLYSPISHCYVCISDFEDDGMDSVHDDDMKRDEMEMDSSSDLYLKCDDMEGTPLLIGETQFCGTCKFLADCKIQLITGQGLCKDRNRIIIHSKHATKFMLQRYDNLNDTGSMGIGHRVLIFVEASRSNKKQFWSFEEETESIVLKELPSSTPTQNEIFVLQKYGQPLRLRAEDEMIISGNNNNNDKQKGGMVHDGYIMDNFLGSAVKGRSAAAMHVQEFYLCHDILRVLSRSAYSGDFIEFTHDAVYGFPKAIFNPKKHGIQPIVASAVMALKPLIQNTAQVRHFVDIHSSTEYGMVSQALCAEIAKHLKDFNILLVQLETRLSRNELTLQNMKFYLQRASRTMAALQHICYDIHLNREKKMSLTSSVSASWATSYADSTNATNMNVTNLNASIVIEHNKDPDDVLGDIDGIIPLGSRGGALLNMVQKHIDTSGEKHVRILYTKLMKAACLPYFSMLSNWIYRGVITDIYGEFMIQEKTHLKKEDVAEEYNNEYWTGRYSLNRLQIPSLLYEYQDVIVTTGKYLNVMRESGCPVEYQQSKEKENVSGSGNHSNHGNNHMHSSNALNSKKSLDLLYKSNSRELGQFINDAYNFAAKALLEMLMNRERIMDRFASIAKYMLLQCGDWFCYFMDMAQSILVRNAADIKTTKLDRLLELSMRTSSSSRNDPFKDDVCCDIKNKDLNKMIMLLHDIRNKQLGGGGVGGGNNSGNNGTLTGLEAFALNYKVQWPASIIFTGRNVIRYQLIFRFLFKLKFVARELKESWKQQMSLRELNLFNTHNTSLMLRHKMLSFIDSLLFYISFQVIEPNWNEFMKNINCGNTKTVDALLMAQETFLRTTLEQCLLTNKDRIDSLFKILICCQQYTNFVRRYTSDWRIYETTKSHKSAERKTAMNMLAQDCRDNLCSTNFTNSIEKYSKGFEQAVRSFLNDLQKCNNSKINMNVLLSRLDFNAYYMPKLSF